MDISFINASDLEKTSSDGWSFLFVSQPSPGACFLLFPLALFPLWDLLQAENADSTHDSRCVLEIGILDNLGFSACYVLIRHPMEGETIHWGPKSETPWKPIHCLILSPLCGCEHWYLNHRCHQPHQPGPTPCKPPGHSGKVSWLQWAVNLSICQRDTGGR